MEWLITRMLVGYVVHTYNNHNIRDREVGRSKSRYGSHQADRSSLGFLGARSMLDQLPTLLGDPHPHDTSYTSSVDVNPTGRGGSTLLE